MRHKKEVQREAQARAIAAYALGRTEAQLEGMAVSAGLPPREFTQGVATLLLSPSIWELLGDPNAVSLVRGKTGKRGTALEQAALAGGAYSLETRGKVKGKKPNLAASWTPERRARQSEMMKRAMANKKAKSKEQAA